jgi:hypothetical protein
VIESPTEKLMPQFLSRLFVLNDSGSVEFSATFRGIEFRIGRKALRSAAGH